MALREGICIGFGAGSSQQSIFPTRVWPFNRQHDHLPDEYLIQANIGDQLVFHLELQKFEWRGADTLMVVISESILEKPVAVILDKETASKGHLAVGAYQCYASEHGSSSNVQFQFGYACPSQNQASTSYPPEQWKSSAYFEVFVYRLVKSSELQRGRTAGELLGRVHFGMPIDHPKPPKRAKSSIMDLKLNRLSTSHQHRDSTRYRLLDVAGNRSVHFVFHYRTTNWVRGYIRNDVEELQTGIIRKRQHGLFAKGSVQPRPATNENVANVASEPTNKRARVKKCATESNTMPISLDVSDTNQSKSGAGKMNAWTAGLTARTYGGHEFVEPQGNVSARAISVDRDPVDFMDPDISAHDVPSVEQNLQHPFGQRLPGYTAPYVEDEDLTIDRESVNNVEVIRESPPSSLETILAKAANSQGKDNAAYRPSFQTVGGNEAGPADKVGDAYVHEDIIIPSSEDNEREQLDEDMVIPSIEQENAADDRASPERKATVEPSEADERKPLINAPEFTLRALDLSARMKDIRKFTEVFNQVQPMTVADSSGGTPAAEHARIRENNARRAEYGAQLANMEIELDSSFLDLAKHLIATAKEDINGLGIPRSTD